MYVRRHGGSEPVGQVLFLMHGLAVQPLHFTQDLREMLAQGKIEASSIIGFRNSGNPQHVITFTVEHYLTFKRVAHEDRELEFFTIFRWARMDPKSTNSSSLSS